MELPEKFIEKYEALLQEEAPTFFTALKKEYKKGFRLNENKVVDKNEVLPFVSLENPAPYSQTGYFGEVSGKTPLHQSGWVYSQEISAMIVAEVADIKENQKVLDLCAAPGGKSTRLGEKLKGTGVLVTNEIFPKRAKALSENIERYGLGNVLVTNHSPQELTKTFEHYFDVVVVDAPCSGEGMFQKEPEALTQWSQEYVLTCQSRQKEILKEAVAMLKPGGELVYSTCTFSPEENEEVIDFLLDEYPLTLIEMDGLLSNDVSHGRKVFSTHPEEIEKTIRLWPHLNEGAGHFVAKLVKKEKDEEKQKKKDKKIKVSIMNKEDSSLWDHFQKSFPLPLTGGHFEVTNHHLWYVPNELPSLDKLRYLRKGLYLGEFLKNRFVPSYSLSMWLKDYKRYPHVKVTLEEWQRYVQGQTLNKEGNQGYVLVVYEDMIVSFGKQSQGVVKNFFPKGLRMNFS